MVQYNWVCIKFLFTFSVKKNLRLTLVYILIGKKYVHTIYQIFSVNPVHLQLLFFSKVVLYIFLYVLVLCDIKSFCCVFCLAETIYWYHYL